MNTARIAQLKAAKAKLEEAKAYLESIYQYGCAPVDGINQSIADLDADIAEHEKAGAPEGIEEEIQTAMMYLEEDLEKLTKGALMHHYERLVTLRKSWPKARMIKEILEYSARKRRVQLTSKLTAEV
jgi:hypothetical protein